MDTLQVTIKDYQAIKEANLEFVEGINAIVGQTNSGKSSILRAIEGAINNKSGNSFVRYEQPFTEVNLKYNNQDITWRKSRKGASTYNINGTELEKIGKAQNQEVADLLNMPEKEIAGTKVRLNFWKQLEYPFLISKTAGQLFDFISKSKDQEIFEDLQDTSGASLKLTLDDIKASNSVIDSKTQDIKRYEETLNTLEQFNSYDTNVLEQFIEYEIRITDILNNIVTQNQEVVRLSNLITTLGTTVTTGTTLVNNIEKDLGKLNTLGQHISVYSRDKSTHHNLEVVYDDLTKLVDRLSNPLEIVSKTLVQLQQVNTKVTQLDKVMDQVKQYSGFIKVTSEGITNYSTIIKQQQDKLNSFEVCPLCGEPLKNHSHKEEQQ
mgnify:CR=1 FL=1